jgi:hypothetical protein
MAEKPYVPEASFSSLVVMLSTSTWVALGKITDPAAGEIRQDLHSAKLSIDTLIMLREKTAGNLDGDEKKLLDEMIGELQANYAETVLNPEGKASASEQTEKDDSEGKAQEKKEEPKQNAKNSEEV